MSKKIVFIEDDEYLTKIYLQTFSGTYKCKAAFSGEDGLNMIRTWMPDLVVLDLMIPGSLSGFDVLETLKEDAELSGIAVVVATNLSDQVTKVRQMGADYCVVKSDLSIDELKSVIQARV